MLKILKRNSQVDAFSDFYKKLLASDPKPFIQGAKAMKDSYVESFLFFKTSPASMEKYLKFGGGVRMGRLLEDVEFVFPP